MNRHQPERPEEAKLFTPGPLTTSPTVKRAMLHDLGSRETEFVEVVRGVQDRLLAMALFTVGVLHPELVLAGLAAGDIQLLLDPVPLVAQPFIGALQDLRGGNPDAHMPDAIPGADLLAFVQGQDHGRIGEIESGIATVLLVRSRFEELLIEANGLGEVAHIEGDMQSILI